MCIRDRAHFNVMAWSDDAEELKHIKNEDVYKRQPQHSIHGLREHEMGLIDSSTYFKALACDHFRRIIAKS